MESVVRKIGGSHYFLIPATSVDAHDIEDGDIWQVAPEKLIKRSKKAGES